MAEVLDAVRGHAVQQRRAVLASRSCPNQIGIRAEERLERPKVAGDDGIRAGLEPVGVSILGREPLDLVGKVAPPLEPVRPRDQELGVGGR